MSRYHCAASARGRSLNRSFDNSRRETSWDPNKKNSLCSLTAPISTPPVYSDATPAINLGLRGPEKWAFWPPRASARCPYSIDAICIGSLWCADRTLPRAMPTKNIAAASITAIAPSFCGGTSLRICLSKSSWSRRSIFEVPIFVSMRNAAKLPLFH